VDWELLNADTVALEFTGFLEAYEFGHDEGSKSVLAGDEHNLTAGELEAGSAESLLGVDNIRWLDSDGH